MVAEGRWSLFGANRLLRLVFTVEPELTTTNIVGVPSDQRPPAYNRHYFGAPKVVVVHKFSSVPRGLLGGLSTPLFQCFKSTIS